MYGIPNDLDLSLFVGATLVQIGLGQFDLQFHFHPDGSVSIQGHWELIDAEERIIDFAIENAERDAYRIHVLLGQVVVGSQLNPPDSFSLGFANGFTLKVFDNSKEYETISIQPGNIYI
jgi:hypothetical protein